MVGQSAGMGEARGGHEGEPSDWQDCSPSPRETRGIGFSPGVLREPGASGGQDGQSEGYPTLGGKEGSLPYEASALESTVVSQLSHQSLIISVAMATPTEGIKKNETDGDPDEFRHSWTPPWTRESVR